MAVGRGGGRDGAAQVDGGAPPEAVRIRGVAVVVEAAGEADDNHGIEDFLDVVARGTVEASGKLFDM